MNQHSSIKDRLLQIPWIYNVVQIIFGTAELIPIFKKELSAFKHARVLELGAGTGGFSPENFDRLTVSDVNEAYLENISVPCSKVVASATDIPFPNNQFDIVFACGLYHHLSDQQYLQSMKEVRRVLKPEGIFLNLDNLIPTRKHWVLARLVRKMDRGKYVRSIKHQKELIESCLKVDSFRNGIYSKCNLEYVIFRASNQQH